MLCEKLLLDAAKKASSNQNLMFVRFANVLGSRGSILPLFQNQIANGGPVTVTDEKMERFFMTIPEACSLVLQTGGIGENGKSYLLDMGEPIKIIDIAKQMIKLSGMEPYKDIDIKIVGARKGERLIEPLWLKEENPTPTKYEKLLQLENKDYEPARLEKLLNQLYPICFYKDDDKEIFRNREKLVQILCDDCESLKNFYEEIKHDGQLRTDML